MPRSHRIFIDPDSRDQEIRKMWIASLNRCLVKKIVHMIYICIYIGRSYDLRHRYDTPSSTYMTARFLARTANEIILGIMKLE